MNLFDNAHSWFGSKEQFFHVVYTLVLPELKQTGKEMLSVFTLFGLLPLGIMLFGKAYRTLRIARQRQLFNKGDS